MKSMVFYIFAPPYTHRSAGCRVLHELCQRLREQGYRAYIVYSTDYFPWSEKRYLNPKLNTVLLQKKDIEAHRKENVTLVTIYPEIVHGNPFDSPYVARYILNFLGVLGGPTSYSSEDFIFCYSHKISETVPDSQQGVLYLPSINREYFWCKGDEKRSNTYFYAYKYRSAGYLPFDLPEGCIEITQKKITSPSPKKIGQMLRQAKALYVFENTQLISEALYCGCPVVLKKNPFFTELIGEKSLVTYGISETDTEAALEAARKDIPLALEAHEAVYQKVNQDLRSILQKLEAFVHAKGEKSYRFHHPYYTPWKWVFVFRVLGIKAKKIMHLLKRRFFHRGY